MNADERQRILNFDDWVRWAPGRFAPIAGARAVNTAQESPSWVCLLYVLQALSALVDDCGTTLCNRSWPFRAKVGCSRIVDPDARLGHDSEIIR